MDINLKDQNSAPFILGSVIQGGFSRKLQMLRSEIFSVLSISQCSKFVSNKKEIKIIKNGILKLLDTK